MVQAPNSDSCFTQKGESGCCKVEAIISIDERGQMVLPKEVRDKAKIKPEDKLVVVSFEEGENVCCIGLIKVEKLAEMVKDMLGPVMKDVLKIDRETQIIK
jgi:AbrB family looped-hinge helix DNA binding protein